MPTTELDTFLRILNISCRNLVAKVSTDDFQQHCIIYCNHILSKGVQLITGSWESGAPSLSPQSTNLVKSTIELVILIYILRCISLIKWQNEIMFHFVEGNPSNKIFF